MSKSCPSCQFENAQSSEYCSQCGTPLSSKHDPQEATELFQRDSVPTPPSSDSSRTHGRFLPGTKIADRYRIVSLLGKGGMGEVYRADDLKLGHTVALKFLPPALAKQPQLLEYFINEVRLSRQISHPNVCRVYDMGEVDGLHFLTMEYIDGEDLKTLLRRIGRLPGDKGIEIARQLCAGLTAAHARGVLHRDLKPSNVMIDGHGQARITDFGLAKLAEDGSDGEIVGTPAYMAPEQLRDGSTDIRSDIYSLGLIFFELFTGKPLRSANTPQEVLQLHDQSTPTRPSQVVADVDPVVERVILRCLESDPKLRPESVPAVAAGLPGGDPLAAALAAGETPSPQLVASVGDDTAITPKLALAVLLAVPVLLLAIIAVIPVKFAANWAELKRTPQELAAIARDLIVDLGYTEPAEDVVYGTEQNEAFVNYIQQEYDAERFWREYSKGFDSAIHFWYRRSPKPLVAMQQIFKSTVNLGNPPMDQQGMISLLLDADGKLVSFRAIPEETVTPQKLTSDDKQEKVLPWKKLIEASGLQFQNAKPASPTWTPWDYADQRIAWTEVFDPKRPDTPLRVEAAAFQGHPTYFRIIAPWTTPKNNIESNVRFMEQVVETIMSILFFCLLAIGVIVAWRNIRLQRGDRRGAKNLALLSFAIGMISWLLKTNHVAGFEEGELFMEGASVSIFFAILPWMIYLAIEPYLRRIWPTLLISWSRIHDGRFYDPLVGRDILLGTCCGLLVGLLTIIGSIAPIWFGSSPSDILYHTDISLSNYLSHVISTVRGAIIATLFFQILFLLTLRVLLRSERVAIVVWWLFTSALFAILAGNTWPAWICLLIGHAILAVVIVRLGLLAGCFFAFARTLFYFPTTNDPASWYFSYGMISCAILCALATYGFYASLGGRPLFDDA